MILIIIKAVGLVAVFAYVFYRSVIAFFIMSPYIYFYLKEKREELRLKRLENFKIQFRDAIQLYSGNLSAGYSVENAWKESLEILEEMHGADSDIVLEIRNMVKKISINIPVSELLNDLAGRTGLEDVIFFAETFQVLKRSGGNFKEIIATTAEAIDSKSNVSREINIMISAKRLEIKIMCVMPLGILLALGLSSPEMIACMYHNPAGILIMTLCLGIYMLGITLSKKLLNIKI